MGARNNKNYSHEEFTGSQFGRAIAHPARFKMIQILKNKGTFRNVDMCAILKMKPSSVHQHIEFLKDADLIHLEYAQHEYHVTLHVRNYEFYLSQL